MLTLLLVVSCGVAIAWMVVALSAYEAPLGDNLVPSDVRQQADLQLSLAWTGTIAVIAANFPACVGRWRAWLGTEVAAAALFVLWSVVVGSLGSYL